MNRLFGSGKKKEPTPTLNDTITTMDARIDSLDAKIRKLDSELLRYKDQLGRLPEGPSKDVVKRQALQVMQQKRQCEQQKTQLMSQSFNLEQTNFTVESMKATQETVTVMKQSAKDLKQSIRKMNVDKVEGLRDELEEMMVDSAEINEVLSRSYATPEYLDEYDLEAELGALQELTAEEGIPSYLDELPTTGKEKSLPSGPPGEVRDANPLTN